MRFTVQQYVVSWHSCGGHCDVVSLKLTSRWSLVRCTLGERSVGSANPWGSDIQWITETVYCTTVRGKWQHSNLSTFMNKLSKRGQCRLSNLQQRSVWWIGLYSRIVCVRVRVTSRLAVYHQTVRLGDNPLETHDHNFYFPIEHLLL
jgi:hypothetical protein